MLNNMRRHHHRHATVIAVVPCLLLFIASGNLAAAQKSSESAFYGAQAVPLEPISEEDAAALLTGGAPQDRPVEPEYNPQQDIPVVPEYNAQQVRPVVPEFNYNPPQLPLEEGVMAKLPPLVAKPVEPAAYPQFQPSTPPATKDKAAFAGTQTTPAVSSSNEPRDQSQGDGGGQASSEPANGLNEKAINDIVKEHNVFRAREHVPPIKWNATLAKYAQKYAEERKGDCKLEHSTGPYGENLMFGEGKNWTWKNTVDMWSDEKKSYDYKSNSCKSGEMCEHYTAVVWRNTTSVGCGRVTCVSGDTVMVCSYWPPGNYNGVKPY